MRFVLILSCVAVMFSCSNNDAVAQSGETLVGSVNPKTPLRQENKPEEAQLSALILRMGEVEAPRGQKVCLPVVAEGFTDLIGFQFTMRHDSAALKYEHVRGFTLPGYGPSSFGTRFADRGYVSTLWTDNNLTGATLPDGAKLFEVCFTNLQAPGETTEVRFADGPTTFEVIAKDMSQRKIAYANGRVSTPK
ncbi:hypothetical protein [Lewinella sp. W8]|uniref:hypothetical protein n=1 Tax=Lewinella sp. W8 TaxID=2528208 RepID=UPI001068361D|nr:hypothetical protein [Lewinella sp. W8]MTB53801.1 hypothetical protein [Lewinella sp. W8]